MLDNVLSFIYFIHFPYFGDCLYDPPSFSPVQDNVPHPFTTFESTGFPSEILREVFPSTCFPLLFKLFVHYVARTCQIVIYELFICWLLNPEIHFDSCYLFSIHIIGASYLVASFTNVPCVTFRCWQCEASF